MQSLMKQLFIDSTTNMADKKISELTPLTDSTIAAADEFAVYDADTNTTKSITKENLDKSTGEVVDSVFTVVDNVDNAKKARFETSSVTTGNTRVLTVPDSDTTLLGTDASQSITNKTIDPSQNTIDGDVLHIDYDPTNYTPDDTTPTADDVDDLAAHLAGIDDALEPTANIEYTYYPSNTDPGTGVGFFNTASLSSSASTYFTFKVPSTITAISEAVIVMIPDTTENISYDLNIDWGQVGEQYDTNSNSLNGQSEAVTADEITEIGLAGLVVSLVADDWVGINFESNTTSLRIVGLRVKYTLN